MKHIALIIAALACLTSCMTDKEYQLRKQDIEAKTVHPATYSPFVIKGPVTIPEGGEMVITVPNMPYQQTAIPDGQAYQLKALGITATTATAITGGYFIKSANKGGDKTTINNYNGTATP